MLTKTKITRIKTGLERNGEYLALIFQALGDGGRLKIFKLLLEHRNLCVTDIANIFTMTVSAASQQLRVLERLGLVEKTRMGQMVCYEINRQSQIVKQLIILFKRSNKK